MSALDLRDAILADSPYIYWKAGEASGNLADSGTGPGNAGVAAGTPTYQQAFTTFSDVVGVGISANNLFSATLSGGTRDPAAASMEAVVKRGAADNCLFAHGRYGFVNGRGFGIDPTSFKFLDTIEATNGTGALGNVAIGAGAEHHVVVTYSGANLITLYVDGVAQTITDTTNPVTADYVSVGAFDNFLCATFRGAHFAYYETALSAARVSAHYNALIAPPAGGGGGPGVGRGFPNSLFIDPRIVGG